MVKHEKETIYFPTLLARSSTSTNLFPFRLPFYFLLPALAPFPLPAP